MKISARPKSEISTSLSMYVPWLFSSVLLYGLVIGMVLVGINTKYLSFRIEKLHVFYFSWALAAIAMAYYAHYVIDMLSKNYIDISRDKLIVRASHGFTSSPVEFNIREVREVAFGQPLNWVEQIAIKAADHGVPRMGSVYVVKSIKKGKLYVTVGKKTSTFNFINHAFDEDGLQRILLALAKRNVPIRVA